MYRFMCTTFKDGRFHCEREGELSGVDLYHQNRSSGLLGFHQLLDGWNRNSIRGSATSGLLHVYTTITPG